VFSQGNTRISEIRTPLRTPSPSETGNSDRLSDLRNWAAQAARQSAQDVGIRSEIAGLLDRMTDEQLELARANLMQILDEPQVSSLNVQTAE
jgi:hypothetical protein